MKGRVLRHKRVTRGQEKKEKSKPKRKSHISKRKMGIIIDFQETTKYNVRAKWPGPLNFVTGKVAGDTY